MYFHFHVSYFFRSKCKVLVSELHQTEHQSSNCVFMLEAIRFEIVWGQDGVGLGTADGSRAYNGSTVRGEWRWSREPQCRQEVDTIVRSASTRL